MNEQVKGRSERERRRKDENIEKTELHKFTTFS
jgi:hypothetical protein